jgi:hypothetical protein
MSIHGRPTVNRGMPLSPRRSTPIHHIAGSASPLEGRAGHGPPALPRRLRLPGVPRGGAPPRAAAALPPLGWGREPGAAADHPHLPLVVVGLHPGEEELVGEVVEADLLEPNAASRAPHLVDEPGGRRRRVLGTGGRRREAAQAPRPPSAASASPRG